MKKHFNEKHEAIIYSNLVYQKEVDSPLPNNGELVIHNYKCDKLKFTYPSHDMYGNKTGDSVIYLDCDFVKDLYNQIMEIEEMKIVTEYNATLPF